jgi:hypothetical protein
VLWPHKKAAIIEGSKIFLQKSHAKYGIPTAEYAVVWDMDAALATWRPPPFHSNQGGWPGTGQGRGHCRDASGRFDAVRSMMADRVFGEQRQQNRH